MACFLSTSCFRNTKLKEAIKFAGDLSDKNVEISAPHPFEEIEDIKKKNIILLFTIISQHQRSHLF